jgi:hypothetical protein
MMIDDGKRVAASGARLQWHMIPIADIDLIARNTQGEENGENGVASNDYFSQLILISFSKGLNCGSPVTNSALLSLASAAVKASAYATR